MPDKLSIKLDGLLCQRMVESRRIEYTTGGALDVNHMEAIA
ncbi:MAG TPA: hypothetical protein VF534_05605 [Paraburkholderia sp.]